MRMIVEAFKDTLELGLEKPKQVVVRRSLGPSIMTRNRARGAGVPLKGGSGAPEPLKWLICAAVDGLAAFGKSSKLVK